MRLRSEVSQEKLRGGFYTPAPIVALCLDRVARLTSGRSDITLLEPSAGDGAFIQGLSTHTLRDRVAKIIAIELNEHEAAKIPHAVEGCTLTISTGSALRLVGDVGAVDALVGNPPYVRFQFVEPAEREAAAAVMQRLGLPSSGVGNLWIPLFLAAVAQLREGGAFAMVLPTEILTGISAGAVRQWLAANTLKLQIDLFEPGSFPAVLQEVAVVSGVRGNHRRPRVLHLAEHEGGRVRRWSHASLSAEGTWTRYLLPAELLERVTAPAPSHQLRKLGEVAAFEVSIVTGANDFFCVSTAEREEYGLEPWTVPLLPRIRHAPGLELTPGDIEALQSSSAKSWLLDFSMLKPDPCDHPAAAAYLASGLAQGLHLRFKTRIRAPWYRVPGVRKGQVLLSKRSHTMPRAVLNSTDAVTTDTIYRGRMRERAPIAAEDLVAGFHNSLTLLSAEIEGRSFGGGVLELVPSEVGRLWMPTVPGIHRELRALDSLSRNGEERRLIERTNHAVAAAVPDLNHGFLDSCEEARLMLQARRFSRN